MKKSIYGLTRDQLIEWLMEHGQKKFRAEQVWDWLYIKRVQSFAEMKNVNKDCLDLLEDNIGCSFCASGLLKKSRDLDAGEIVGQIMKVQEHLDQLQKDERVSHIVVMGIGEPFDNYKNLMNFLRTVNDQKGLAIGARHITVSTSGLAKKIMDFANENIQVNLAVSLHAPNDELRSQIMVITKAFQIEKVKQIVVLLLSISYLKTSMTM